MKLQVLLEKGHWLAVGVSVVAAVGHAVQSAIGDAVGICSGLPNGSAVGPIKLVDEVGVSVDKKLQLPLMTKLVQQQLENCKKDVQISALAYITICSTQYCGIIII